jgi:hypothetical protein
MATVATRPTKKHVHKKPRIDLTPTGLLMEAFALKTPAQGILSEMGILRQPRLTKIELRCGLNLNRASKKLIGPVSPQA